MSELYKLNKDMLIKLIGSIQEELEFYCVFQVIGQRFIFYEFLGPFITLQKAKEFVAEYFKEHIKHFKKVPSKGLCNDMNIDNDYTYIGNRDDIEEHEFYGYGGYIIEKQKLNT